MKVAPAQPVMQMVFEQPCWRPPPPGFFRTPANGPASLCKQSCQPGRNTEFEETRGLGSDKAPKIAP